jgi:hypothetical protein
MQNRALIYIVCLVAIASLTLLIISDQGFVDRSASDLDYPAQVAFASKAHSYAEENPNASDQGDSIVDKQSLDRSYAVTPGDLPATPSAVLSAGPFEFPMQFSTSETASVGKAPEYQLLASPHQIEDPSIDSPKSDVSASDADSWSRVGTNEVKAKIDGFSTLDQPANFSVNANEGKSQRLLSGDSRQTERAVAARAVSSRASLIDRPETGSPSNILQVQNQQPTTGSDSEDGEAQELGVPPPQRTPAFLKKRSILLEPGQYQFEYGLRYSVDNNTYALAGLLQEGTNTVQVVNANQKRQLVSTPLEMRIGLQENLQGFLTLPIGWSAQSLTAGNSHSDSDLFGIGDLGIGLTRVMWAPEKAKVRILGFLQASVPTGGGEISLSQQDREASLGAGYWTLTAGGNITESIDPLILFGSAGYTHTFGTRIESGNYIDVGNTLFYQVGVGYGINPFVTVSGSFSGASSGRIQLDDNVAAGARSEPFSLRLSASVNKPNEANKSKLGTNYEPFLRFGLTSLANDVEFGIRWTY